MKSFLHPAKHRRLQLITLIYGCVCDGVSPQVDGADVSLDAGCGTQHLATVLPQALEHHLHGVLRETQSTATSQTTRCSPMVPR